MPQRDRAAYMRAYRARRKTQAPRRRARKTAQDPAAAVAAWATATLQVPAGLLRGQPFALADWQVAWLRGALAPGIREARVERRAQERQELACGGARAGASGWPAPASRVAGGGV